MIVYEGVKTDFLQDVRTGTLVPKIKEALSSRMHTRAAESQVRAWINSLREMYFVIDGKDIPDNAGIAIEYGIPQTAKRVDFMISGYSGEGVPGMVIVELKQWSSLQSVPESGTLVRTYLGGGARVTVHPSYQAWSYAQLIADYNTYVQDKNVKLAPCAYLHNYLKKERDPLAAPQYKELTDEAPAFCYGDALKLKKFISQFIRKGDDREVLYLTDHGKIRPSKSLQDSIASMMKGNAEFVMIDDQKVAYETILRTALKCQKTPGKETIICVGGPGTGKSVIAVNLLASLTLKGQLVQYVSANSAPRQVYSEKLKGSMKKSSVSNLFQGSGAYIDKPRDCIPTLIVDEAHRLRAKSGIFHNMGENQIREIIHAAKCSVFFVDDRQRVTFSDIGSEAEIKKQAALEGSNVTVLALSSQFRCNGSDGYLAWLDNTLEIRESANLDLTGTDYDFRVFDSPEELAAWVRKKNAAANKARILAGYCWEWPKAGRAKTDWHDIKIGDFGISWNLENGQNFATSPTSVNEAGCIHTSQGLEFDYVGVIIGNDMRFVNGRILTDFTRRAKSDQSVKGLKKLYRENRGLALKKADEIIKNTYRTLMTRGMKGCGIYCTDPELASYFRKMATPLPSSEK